MKTPVRVILAGGASTRLGQCKALADLGGGATPLGELLRGGTALVVGGADAEAIRAALPPGAEFVHNTNWASGRLSSVQAAVRARPGLDLCLAPVDVPLVPALVFEELARAWQAAGSPARGWLAPWVENAGRRTHGHPLLIGRDLLAEILEAAPDLPLKNFRSRARPLLELEVASKAILDDLDTPEDLARLRTRRGF